MLEYQRLSSHSVYLSKCVFTEKGPVYISEPCEHQFVWQRTIRNAAQICVQRTTWKNFKTLVRSEEIRKNCFVHNFSSVFPKYSTQLANSKKDSFLPLSTYSVFNGKIFKQKLIVFVQKSCLQYQGCSRTKDAKHRAYRPTQRAMFYLDGGKTFSSSS